MIDPAGFGAILADGTLRFEHVLDTAHGARRMRSV